MVEEFEDLTAPGRLDEILRDEPEEGSEEMPEEASKQQAAFVKLRKDKKLLQDALRQVRTKAEQNGRSQPAPTPGQMTEQQRAAKTYQDGVMRRAIEITPSEGMTQEAYNQSVYLNCTAIIANDAVANSRRQDMESRAPTVIESVLSEFSQLDEGDRTTIKDRLGKMDASLQANQAAVKKEVHSYLGEHFDKFAEKKEESEPEQDKWPTKPPGRAAADEIPSRTQALAGAAVASEGKGGSKGIPIPKKAKQSSESEPPTLSQKDREIMRNTGKNPAVLEDVKFYLRAKRKAASTSTSVY